MDKRITKDIANGRFVLGRRSAERFGAVEGVKLTHDSRQIMLAAENSGETADEQRTRILRAFRDRAR